MMDVSKRLGGVATVLAGVCIAGPAFAEGDSPWSFDVANVIDYASNVSGGVEQDEVFLYNLDVTAELDMSKLGVEGGTLFFYGLANNSAEFNPLVGDAQGASNIDNGHLVRLEEAWYNQEFAGGKANVLVGLFDLNGEFDAIDSAGLFLNSSHGIGVDYAQTGENGPSIFPTTSLTIRLDYAFNEQFTGRIAILDAVPNDPDSPTGHSLSLDEGALVAAEINYEPNDDLRLGAGLWWYSEEFDRIEAGAGANTDTSVGFYGFADYALRDNVSAWIRLGHAADEVNQIAWYLGSGVVMSGPFASRPDDSLGFAIAIAENGSPFKDAALAAMSPVDDREITLELTYEAPINDWFTIHPDIQYILDPGMDPSLEDALVIIIRAEIGWSF